jgi:CBS domain-containing protein
MELGRTTMRVKDVMTTSPRSCAIGRSANEAAQIMWEQDCGSVPVLDSDGRPVGMVTDRDICMAAYFRGEPLTAIPVADVMSHEVCTCGPDADVSEAEQRMRQWRVRRLPVVNTRGSLVGMLSLSDLAQGVTKNGGIRQGTTDGRGLLETVAVVSEPRHA